jgi:hypothetical protein
MKRAFLPFIIIECLISINFSCIFVNANTIETININHPPVLSDGIVFPTTITQNSPFLYFKVHYYDEDGDPPYYGMCTNYVLIKKTDPGEPFTGINDMLVKHPFSHNTDMYIFIRFLHSYTVGNYSARFCVMWDDTTTPYSYVYYPPLDKDPLKFEVINSDPRLYSNYPFLFSFLHRILL